MQCVVCPPDVHVVPTIESGVAGASARREHDRRSDKRSAELRDRWGDRVGGWIDRLTVEPQSTRAWAVGAVGEERLAEALSSVEGLEVLHDRRVPGTKGNIDHIAIGPAGVFVIDAKFWEGTIQIRDVGGWFRTDRRLYVGRRDRSDSARKMGWQVEAVSTALTRADIEPIPPVTPVLCFIDGSWPWFRPPGEFEGVRLESERSLAKLFAASQVLDVDSILRIKRVVAAALPAK